jgi:hypothetical protein
MHEMQALPVPAPQAGADRPPTGTAAPQRALYPAHYPWFLGLAAADVLLTAAILALGGTEANAVAEAVLRAGGVPGMVIFKSVSVGIVLAVCQVAGRLDQRVGLRLAEAAIALNTVPVTVGMFCLGELLYAHSL